MRTRCPVCCTVFRVTSEQLRLKAGKVRCGSCQHVFNAFDHWQPDAAASSRALPGEAGKSHAEEYPQEIAPSPEPVTEPSPAAEEAAIDRVDEFLAWPAPAATVEIVLPAVDMPVAVTPDVLPRLVESRVIADTVPEAMSPEPEPQEIIEESPEASTQAARQAGLVAARELSDTPAFNRWAAGTLAGDDRGGFAGESSQRPVWPFVLVAVLLFFGLLAQLFYHFRTEIVLRLPATAAWYELLAIDVPLPRNAALVSIETSDLQSDNTRGLFVLQATLKNRAGYAQAWPALELSLTDTNDRIVSRRVMFAADFLPPGTKSEVFPANGDLAVKLWIEAKDVGATGYRLYIFYP